MYVLYSYPAPKKPWYRTQQLRSTAATITTTTNAATTNTTGSNAPPAPTDDTILTINPTQQLHGHETNRRVNSQPQQTVPSPLQTMHAGPVVQITTQPFVLFCC
jgi:hypothetical protein